MPKFGKAWFGSGPFGEKRIYPWDFKRTYRGVPLGFSIQRSINKEVTFRVRRGNGYYGSPLGKQIQDKYKYTVPSSINNPQGQRARDLLAEAVANWKTLDEATKQEYNKRASKMGGLSGYNLYIREYIRENY